MNLRIGRFLKHSMFKCSIITGVALAASLQPLAAANLVQNGDFESNGGVGQIAGITTLTDWTLGPTVVNSATPAGSPAFDFVMDANASTTGARSIYNGSVYLKGNVPASPNGGDFIGADGGYASAALQQQIAALAPNTTYTLSFDWAASQLTICDAGGTPCTGNTVDNWQVSIDGQTFTTTPFHLVSGQFSNWMNYTTTFTTGGDLADNTLSFLAQGSPDGEPPFLLLDSVSLTPDVPASSAPEPGSVMLLAGGALGLFGAARLRKKRA